MKIIFIYLEVCVSRHMFSLVVNLSLIALLAACSPSAAPAADVSIVATNSIIADVVSQVAGGLADLEVLVLVPSGADPHAYEPSAQDVAAVADADVVFSNGLGLEGFLEDLIANAGGDAQLVDLSEGIATIVFEEGEHHDHDEGEEHDYEEGEEHEDEHEDEHEGEEGHEHDHEGPDPHVWTNPLNIVVWVEHIAEILAEVDPANADTYQANAAAYIAELEALDAWAVEQIGQIPVERRLLVTDHEVFGYFAERYDFEVVGAVIPGASTLSESSAAEIAELHELIDAHDVPAIFVGFTVNETVAERIAEDTGAQLVPLYSESLGEAGGPADSYIAMFRYNIVAIVDALTVE